MLFKHSVIVIIKIGTSKKKTKCQILLKRSFLIFTLNAINKPIKNGVTNANDKSAHRYWLSRFINCELNRITKNTKTVVTAAPILFEILVLDTSKLAVKNFDITFNVLLKYLGNKTVKNSEM